MTLASQLPLRVRVRLEVVDALGKTVSAAWVHVNVQPGGSFMLSRNDFKGPVPAELRVQAWFDRTDLLASSRSPLVTVKHQVAPVIN